MESIIMIPINQITSFPNHPFKVRDDEKMMETVESVKKRGVIFPAIVRKKKDGTYEMVAGHRRRRACQLAQLSEMPCIVRELTDDEATILMVDSNVQREEILPSERAWAFKMKLEALNRQGKRVDLTSTPSVQKLSVEIVAEEFGISREQVRRYVALTNLDSALLKMVDENKIALRPAVQISYMKKQDQKELLDAIESFDATPSEKQAKLLRDLSEKGILDRDKIDEIMAEEKPNQVVQYKIKYERFRKYLPKNVETEQEVEDFLLICIKEHYNRVKQREMVR
ncbi:MAG: ParB/RepB/Spo0J family partition protein [Clostridia bacterium]|jgi:ParB/RepB/Spo0J family partition protein